MRLRGTSRRTVRRRLGRFHDVAPSTRRRDVAPSPGDSRAGGALWLIAVAAIAGSALGAGPGWPDDLHLEWIAIAIAGGAAIVALQPSSSRVTRLRSVLLATATIASARGFVAANTVPPGQLALLAIADERIVTIEGLVTGTPLAIDRRGDPFESFGRARDRLVFPVEIDRIDDRPSAARRGATVTVVVDAGGGGLSAIATGDRIRARGILRRTIDTPNPGVRRDRLRAIENARRVVLAVRSPVLVRTIETTTRSTVVRALDAWRAHVTIVLDQVLSRADAGHDPDRSERVRALARSLLLGARGPEFERFATPWRRSGLAHYLALSGFALAVAIGVLAAPARLLRRRPALAGSIALLVLTLVVLSIEPGVAAMRAAAMLGATFFATIVRRRIRLPSLAAAAALIALALDPLDVLRAGFQLSYGVVVALGLLAEPLDRRLFGGPVERDGRASSITIAAARRAIAASLAAWAVSTPIVAWHFGTCAPLGAPASALAAAPLALVVAGASIATVAAIARSAIGSHVEHAPTIPYRLTIDAPGTIAFHALDLVDRAANAISTTPAGAFATANVGPVWVGLTLLVIVRLILHRHPAERPMLLGAIVVLTAWMVRPPAAPGPHGSFEITTLAVGDGTCHLVRGPTGAFLVDAGSNSFDLVGGRIIVPALRSHGVRRLEALVVTHPNLDHYGGAVELLDHVGIDRLLTAPRTLEDARDEPGGPVALFLSLLRDRGIAIETIGDGDVRSIARVRVETLHPPRDAAFVAANDHSLVLRLRAEDAAVSTQAPTFLISGDLEEAGMRSVLERHGATLEASVAELPHHGSVRPSSAEYLRAVAPRAWVQSTGRSRLRRDRIGALLETRSGNHSANVGAWRDDGSRRTPPVRFVTALEGAIRTRLSPEWITCASANRHLRWWTERRSDEPGDHGDSSGRGGERPMLSGRARPRVRVERRPGRDRCLPRAAR